jgi:hypothetical protein
MIRCVTISEFGPDGLAYAIYDAPGAMCVVTVPGLTVERPEAKIDKPAVFVIAGNRKEFLRFIKLKGLLEWRDAFDVCDKMDLLGLVNTKIVFAGNYIKRGDYRELSNLVWKTFPHANISFDDCYLS